MTARLKRPAKRPTRRPTKREAKREAKRSSGRPRANPWPRRLLWMSMILVLAVAAAGAASWWAWRRIEEPFQAWPGPTARVLVEPGTSGIAILNRLESAGVLTDARLARLYLVYTLDDPPLQAGEYLFDRPRSIPEVLDMLVRGEVLTLEVTIVEGLTLWETADLLAEAGFGERDAFVAAMSSPELIADLDPEARTLEGYLFPSTYRFAGGTGEKAVVETLVRTFRETYRQNVEPLLAETGAETVTPTMRAVTTLASIVEEEARLDEERPVIAGVYANRLRSGIALYADPTVIYALRLAGRWDGNIRRQDLKIDSPYNTYLYPGLPPGPIASPGRRSLEAAAAPAGVPYLYFVSRNDGSHVFSSTLGEHNRNVDRWQRRYWREKWAAEKAARTKGAEKTPQDKEATRGAEAGKDTRKQPTASEEAGGGGDPPPAGDADDGGERSPRDPTP